MAKVRVDAVRGAEAADRLDGSCRGAAEPQRLLGSDDVLELRELRPPGEHEAAVAAARTAAADVALDEHDVERRIVLLERDRGPEARVAAAHDAHVGLLVALEARRVLVGAAERLLQPQAPHAEDDSRRADRPGQDGGSAQSRSMSSPSVSRLARLWPLTKRSM